ncbi:MAG: HD domain-containing protein [Oligoflexia bacterium]|nr:HD domain-containing protein [Oligoflexia bacterium]
MVTKDFLKRLFSLASIQRWNDHLRPIKLTELDKQAHKMMIAYVLAKSIYGNSNESFNWQKLIEAEIFEFIRNMVLTDIKRTVFTFLVKHKKEEINRFIFKSVESDIKQVAGGELWDKMVLYFTDDNYSKNEKSILELASKIASLWEYNLICDLNRQIHNVDEIRQDLKDKITHNVQADLISFRFKKFINLYGQLRFQVRWARTPRTPETSVLGHLLITAIITYLFMLETKIKFSPKRIYNNFFAALFHDLPEALTWDIISPVKSGIEGLDKLVKEYEKEAIKLHLLPSLPLEWHREILYFIEDEFDNKIMDDENKKTKIKVATTSGNEFLLEEIYNHCKFNPLDGRLVRVADELSAYLEAVSSIEHGIKSPDLEDGKNKIRQKYCKSQIAGIKLDTIFK